MACELLDILIISLLITRNYKVVFVIYEEMNISALSFIVWINNVGFFNTFARVMWICYDVEIISLKDKIFSGVKNNDVKWEFFRGSTKWRHTNCDVHMRLCASPMFLWGTELFFLN